MADSAEKHDVQDEDSKTSKTMPCSGARIKTDKGYVSYHPQVTPSIPIISSDSPLVIPSNPLPAELAFQKEKTVPLKNILVLIHDLRQPITIIMGDAELAASMNTQEQLDEVIEEINEGAVRLKQITDLLLTVCNPEAEGLAIQKKSTEISEYFKETLSKYKPEKGVFSTNTVTSPTNIDIDPAWMERVIANLISNAIKFGNFALVSLDRDESAVTITVTDRGEGLPEDCKSIFEMFKQGENAEGIPGSGIGLASCKAIVEAHGGSITCENMFYESNGKVKGAKFTVRLPIPAKNTKCTQPSPQAL